MIKIVTLKIGINLLCDVEENEDTIVVKKPVAVLSQPGQNGQTMIGFSPFLEYVEEFKTGITLKREDVLTFATPNTELENQYSQIFGSGIQIASADMLK